jgi:drug/metabolite transporter (DMT)-like permease
MNFSPAVLGLLLSTAAFALFSGFDVSMKMLVGKFSSYQLASTTYGLSDVFLALFLFVQKGRAFLSEIRFQKIPLHFARGIAQATALAGFMMGLAHMPLADYYVLSFLTPLFVPIFALFIVREHPGSAIWAALAVSFIGVVIAFHPTATPNPYVLICMFGAACYGLSFVIMRKMTATESPYAIMFSMNFIVFAVLLIFALPTYVIPNAHDMLFFGAAALSNVIGYFLITKAAQMAPASLIIAPQFLQLVYGVIAGYLFFGDVPERSVLIGGAVVVAANLYLLWTQNKKAA